MVTHIGFFSILGHDRADDGPRKEMSDLDTDYKAATCNKIIFFIFEGILCFPGEM